MSDSAPPAVRLTPEEKRLYGQLFHIADSEKLGVITGQLAVEFFKKSRLTPSTLAEIWTIADAGNQGFLTQKTWSIALRLIAHAQKGELPTPELANRPGPPWPVFEGVQLPTSPPQATPTASTPSTPNRVPPIGPTERERYRNMFANTGARDGLLDGEQARTFFLRAKLPTETLGQIWALADTHNRGALDLTEFTIAMHLIQSLMANKISAVPVSLPPDLFTAASAGQFQQSHVQRTPSVSSTSSGRAPTLPPKIQQSPIRTTFTGGSQFDSDGWDVSPADKINFDSLFRSIDKGNKGFIDGTEAVTFFLTSKLPEDLLAHIWDLSDIRREGRLNRDTFAVAMYLIRQKIAGKDLPQTLPASLVPPSMRQAIPAQPAQPPVLQEPQPSSAAQDLFGLDAAFGLTTQPTGSPAPAFRPQSGLQSPARTTSPIQITSSPKPASPVVSTTPLGRTFQPTSDFGRTIATPILDRSKPVTFGPAVQASPSGFSQLNPPAPPQIAMQSGSVFGDQDLLGDADPEISQQLTAETAELANLSNQIGSLNNATRDLQSNKAKAETELATVSQQKRDIEARLKQIRALYDAEVNNVKAVESQLTTVRAELGKNRQEFTVLEASFHALQAQVEDQKSTLQKDQTENAALRTKIASVGEEIKQLKETLEKLKRDARQQRGMVAINKKQLSTSEGERDKIQGEIDSEKQAIEALKAEAAAVAAAAAAAAAVAPSAVARDVTSPAPSERSQGTNPFLRMQSTGDAAAAFSPPAPFSPPATQTWSDFPEEAFSNAFPQPTSPPAPAPFAPSVEKIEHPSLQQVRDASVEQTAPPSIASALSPPLDAREFSAPVESETSSLAVNPPRSAVGSVNGDAPSQPVSESKSPKEDEIEAVGPVAESVAPPVYPLSSDEIVISDVQEQEVKESFSEAEPTPPVPAETIEAPVPTSDVLSSHGPRSAEGVTSPDIVQETLSHPPHDEDLAIPGTEHEITEATEAKEPETKQEKEDEENKGASLPGGFPSEGSDEGRESWVDLGDESKSLPSEQSAAPLPSNRSDPFAFETSSAPPRAATKEDFDAAFSSFGNFEKKEENGVFKKDFDSEFPPIEEFDHPESDSDDEPDGFNDNFAEKGKEIADTNGTSKIAETGQQVETPLQQTLPVAPTLETLAKPASTVGSPDTTAPLTDIPPPLPPKDKLPLPLQLESMATGARTPAERELKPPAYTEYGNIADTSSGSNDLSGLLPTRGEPHARPAPYTSPPPRAEFSTPTPFQPAQPVSFSPPPPPPPPAVAVTAPTYATAPTASALTSQAVAEPSASASFGNFGSFPTTTQPIPTKPVQTFDAFDFSGLQEAAPLDEEVPEDSFRDSQGFGEFDTTFDSAPVTPAKSSTQQPSAPQPTNDFSNFSWDAPPDFGTSQAQHAPQPPSFSSNFDDVFASFDRPTTITPPTLPPRDAAAQDDPNLKTLTEMGFSRDKAVAALEKHNYNLTEATNYLLEH